MHWLNAQEEWYAIRELFTKSENDMPLPNLEHSEQHKISRQN